MQRQSTSPGGLIPSPIVFSRPLLDLDHEVHHPHNPFSERPGTNRQRRVRFFIDDSQMSEKSPAASPSVDRRVLREMMGCYDQPLVQPSCQRDTSLTQFEAEYPDPPRSPHQVRIFDDTPEVISEDELGGFQPTRKIDNIQRRRSCLLGRCFSNLLSHDAPTNVERQPTRRDIDTSWYPLNRYDMPNGHTYSAADYQGHQSEYFAGNDILLRGRSISRKDLRWHIGEDPSTAIVPYGSDIIQYWNRPVLGLTISTAYIHLKESRLWRLERVFGPIIAQTSGPHHPITFHHLLNAIYTYFRHAVSYDQISSLGLTAEEGYLLDVTRQERIRGLRRNRGNIYSHNAWKCVDNVGIQRVDLLSGFCGFKKLRLDSVHHRSCHLVLSLR